jgi:hypothetical protein
MKTKTETPRADRARAALIRTYAAREKALSAWRKARAAWRVADDADSDKARDAWLKAQRRPQPPLTPHPPTT